MNTGPRTAVVLTVLFLGSTLSASGGSASWLVGNVSVGLGEKWRSEPSFPHPVRDGGTRELAANVMLGHGALPVLLNAYFARTREDVEPDTDEDVIYQETRVEAGLGLARIWRVGPVRPHIGAGVARLSSDTESPDPLRWRGHSVTKTGSWISAGAILPLVAGFNIGAMGRYTNVNSEFRGELGGLSASALVGWVQTSHE